MYLILYILYIYPTFMTLSILFLQQKTYIFFQMNDGVSMALLIIHQSLNHKSELLIFV